jgi:hypothetical protein
MHTILLVIPPKLDQALSRRTEARGNEAVLAEYNRSTASPRWSRTNGNVRQLHFSFRVEAGNASRKLSLMLRLEIKSGTRFADASDSRRAPARHQCPIIPTGISYRAKSGHGTAPAACRSDKPRLAIRQPRVIRPLIDVHGDEAAALVVAAIEQQSAHRRCCACGRRGRSAGADQA